MSSSTTTQYSRPGRLSAAVAETDLYRASPRGPKRRRTKVRKCWVTQRDRWDLNPRPSGLTARSAGARCPILIILASHVPSDGDLDYGPLLRWNSVRDKDRKSVV